MSIVGCRSDLEQFFWQVGEQENEIYGQISEFASDQSKVDVLIKRLEVLERVERAVFASGVVTAVLREHDSRSTRGLVTILTLYIHAESDATRAMLWECAMVELEQVRLEAEALGRAQLELEEARARHKRAEAELRRAQAARDLEKARQDAEAACAIA
jgi:hypothetical protein